MRDLAWGEVLSVDVDEIDQDHKKLVELFNLLAHAVDDSESAEYVAAVFEELVNCTVWHFSHEERLMLKYAYPQSGEHKVEHRALIDSAKALQQKIHAADNAIGDDDIEYLERWLTEHILTDDMRLGDYLSQVM